MTVVDSRGLEKPDSLTFRAIQNMPSFCTVEEGVFLVKYYDKKYWAVKASWFAYPMPGGGKQARLAYFDAFTGEYLGEV